MSESIDLTSLGVTNHERLVIKERNPGQQPDAQRSFRCAHLLTLLAARMPIMAHLAGAVSNKFALNRVAFGDDHHNAIAFPSAYRREVKQEERCVFYAVDAPLASVLAFVEGVVMSRM